MQVIVRGCSCLDSIYNISCFGPCYYTYREKSPTVPHSAKSPDLVRRPLSPGSRQDNIPQTSRRLRLLPLLLKPRPELIQPLALVIPVIVLIDLHLLTARLLELLVAVRDVGLHLRTGEEAAVHELEPQRSVG